MDNWSKVTAENYIIHSKGNYLRLPNSIKFTLDNIDFNSRAPSRFFLNENSQKLLASKQNLLCYNYFFVSEKNLSWKEVKKIIDKLHKHVCGHASLSDIQILEECCSLEILKYENISAVLFNHV